MKRAALVLSLALAGTPAVASAQMGTLKASVEARYYFVNGSNGASNSSFVPLTSGMSF